MVLMSAQEFSMVLLSLLAVIVPHLTVKIRY